LAPAFEAYKRIVRLTLGWTDSFSDAMKQASDDGVPYFPGVTDHGALTGLADDDHTQYIHTATPIASYAVGDIIYASSTTVLSALAMGTNGKVLTAHTGAAPTWETPTAGVTDHGLLSGLADDDHTQYVNVSGVRDITGPIGVGVYNTTQGVVTAYGANNTLGGTYILYNGATGATNVDYWQINTDNNGLHVYRQKDITSTEVLRWNESSQITVGSWHATAIAADHGGTGQTVYAVGDLLYASTTTALSKLAGVAVGQVLVSGGVNTAPAWSASPVFSTLYGGVAANDDIAIRGTSHATKTTSYVLLQPDGGKVGIGLTTPDSIVEIYGNALGAPSLLADCGIAKISTDYGQDLTFGALVSGTYGFWIQVKKSANDGGTLPLLLNPAGGNVEICGGYASTGMTVTAEGVITSNGAATFDGLVTCGDKLKVTADGTDALPAIYWGTDTNTGLSHFSDVVYISAGGVCSLIASAGGISTLAGSVDAPSYKFGIADADTGLYYIAENNFGVSCGGYKIADFAYASGAKVGLWGVNPVARATHIADATNSTDVITRVNAILVVLENFGAVLTS
jgi:hypothetical protein